MTAVPGPRRVQLAMTREPDDKLADARASIGKARGMEGYYLVFRGEPQDVIDAIELVLTAAKSMLPAGQYTDKRGRPQG